MTRFRVATAVNAILVCAIVCVAVSLVGDDACGATESRVIARLPAEAANICDADTEIMHLVVADDQRAFALSSDGVVTRISTDRGVYHHEAVVTLDAPARDAIWSPHSGLVVATRGAVHRFSAEPPHRHLWSTPVPEIEDALVILDDAILTVVPIASQQPSAARIDVASGRRLASLAAPRVDQAWRVSGAPELIAVRSESDELVRFKMRGGDLTCVSEFPLKGESVVDVSALTGGELLVLLGRGRVLWGTDSELDLDQIWHLVDDLIEAHGDWLPTYS